MILDEVVQHCEKVREAAIKGTGGFDKKDYFRLTIHFLGVCFLCRDITKAEYESLCTLYAEKYQGDSLVATTRVELSREEQADDCFVHMRVPRTRLKLL